jgi:hypothetical protein
MSCELIYIYFQAIFFVYTAVMIKLCPFFALNSPLCEKELVTRDQVLRSQESEVTAMHEKIVTGKTSHLWSPPPPPPRRMRS